MSVKRRKSFTDHDAIEQGFGRTIEAAENKEFDSFSFNKSLRGMTTTISSSRLMVRLIFGSLICLSLFGMMMMNESTQSASPTTKSRHNPGDPYRCSSDLQQIVTAYLNQTTPKGIILPLFDDIATLGVSLIRELREIYQVNLPIEIPHCGDLAPKYQMYLARLDPNVIVYDVCQRALATPGDEPTNPSCLCRNLRDCHSRYRNFNIKLLAVTLSQFEEYMLLDADTLFFQNPMQLWELDVYKDTGTLFFHDRISCETTFLAERHFLSKENQNVTHLHKYLHQTRHLYRFKELNTIERESTPQVLLNPVINLSLPFEPSDFLLTSHSWNARAGHQMDSSLVLWHKTKQARASSILASFIVNGGLPRPPSYGDKELFFIACEVAETRYAFSYWGVGSIGNNPSENDSVLCGQAMHYHPSEDKHELLYMNSDDILNYNTQKPIYRTIERPASFYAGSFLERKLPQECPFNVQIVKLTEKETQVIKKRQFFHQQVVS